MNPHIPPQPVHRLNITVVERTHTKEESFITLRVRYSLTSPGALWHIIDVQGDDTIITPEGKHLRGRALEHPRGELAAIMNWLVTHDW